MDGGNNAEQIDIAMQLLPFSPAQLANCPLIRGCSEWNQEKESSKSCGYEGTFENILGDLVDRKVMVEADKRQEVQYGIEEGEKPEKTAHPEQPVHLRDGTQRRDTERDEQ